MLGSVLIRTCFVLVLLALITRTNSLEASFLPNSENEPLPLSAKYRDSLRKLCILMNTEGALLPPEVVEKKDILAKVCAKLEKDDRNINAASSEQKFGIKQKLMYGIIGIGSGYYLWSNRKWLKTQVNNLMKGKGPQGQIVGQSVRSAPHVDTLFGDGPAAAQQVSAAPVAHEVPVAATADKIAEARAARLKRFSEMNAVGSVDSAQ